MEQSSEEIQVERKGSLLERQIEWIFHSAGFQTSRDTFQANFEVDVFAEFGDLRVVIECKQYERSYLPVRNLILDWKGKNEYIKADCVVLALYGIEITQDQVSLAEESGIQIWGIDYIEYLLGLVNDLATLQSAILKRLQMREPDITEVNEYPLKRLIALNELLGKGTVPEEELYGFFRGALRKRIITRLRLTNPTAEARSQHVDFFENVIRDTVEKRVLIFRVKRKLTNKELWQDVKKKLGEIHAFSEELTEQYLHYMHRLEEGFEEYKQWFFGNREMTHRKLITIRLHFTNPHFALFGLPDPRYGPSSELHNRIANELFMARSQEIILDESKIPDLHILQWILTDEKYKIVSVQDESGKVIRREVHWYPGSLEETVELACGSVKHFV